MYATVPASTSPLADDIAKDKYGIESVTASKVMECIPCALRQILQVEN